jgi:hypothetical protein
VSVLKEEAKDGLYPAGHQTCLWGYRDRDGEAGNHYPAEYTGALDYLKGGEYSDQRSFRHLNRLVFKIDCEAKAGTPLCSKIRSWCDDGFPPEYHAVKAYMSGQMANWEAQLLAA